jgi:hypothetical protein
MRDSKPLKWHSVSTCLQLVFPKPRCGRVEFQDSEHPDRDVFLLGCNIRRKTTVMLQEWVRKLMASTTLQVLGQQALQAGSVEKPPLDKTPALSTRDSRIHDIVGETNFATRTNAEIMRDGRIKRQLKTDFSLQPGTDSIKCGLDRIRRAKGYPLSREIARKRSNQN